MGNTIDYANKVTVSDLDTVYITGAGYNRKAFKGISRDSAMGWEEPVWSGELSRDNAFSLSNINDVEFGLVSRVELSFKYMNIEDYKALCRIAKQRTCVVDYFSRDLGERVEQEMAFTNNELGKLYAFGTEYLGILDVSIKLVATNNDNSKQNSSYTISYNSNGGTGTILSATKKWSENYVLSSGEGFTKVGSGLLSFNTEADGSGWAYLPNQSITVFKDLTLYAQWGAVATNLDNNLPSA